MARDPYKYFRVEARELIEQLGQGFLGLEKTPVDATLAPRLLRLAHTLKGAARVVKQPEIAQRAHAVEEILLPLRESGSSATRQQLAELLSLVDQAATAVSALEAAPDRAPALTPQATHEELLRTVRVDIEDVDALLRGVGEAGVQLGALERELSGFEGLETLAGVLANLLVVRGDSGALSGAAVERARVLSEALRVELDRLKRGLVSSVERVEGELTGLRDTSQQLRLIPVKGLFPVLERAVHDAAQALGKRVEFATSGGDVRLDAHVLAALRDALLHVVRNAVTHGIELPGERVAAGKDATGSVLLEVERRGNRAFFRCRDDGRGIDVERVRRTAVARGLVEVEQASSMTPSEVMRLLLLSGMSTSERVTQLSGRGIGLDAVREIVARLKGEVEIESVRGCAVVLRVPVSVASITALLVDVAGATHAIPLDAVRSTLRLPVSRIAHAQDRQSVEHDGQPIPFVPLEHALGRSGAGAQSRGVWSTVVVAAQGRVAALGVDRVLGTTSVVVRALPASLDIDPVVAGATLDSEGNPQLVLDPSGLVLAAQRQRGAMRATASRPRPPILVVDDSLTTRMLEQSILETAGYTVEVAVSAEEALEKARSTRYGLFVVDVEMPGMDGFEFVTRTRADPSLQTIPAVLVTSRNAPEDQRRGETAGASAYIVKGEFDQGLLLTTIRKLVG